MKIAHYAGFGPNRTANPANAKAVTAALENAVGRIRSGEHTRETDVGKVCDLATYAERVNRVYEAAVGRRPMNEVRIPLEKKDGTTDEKRL